MGPPRYTGAHMPRTRRRAAAVSPARRQRRTHALLGAEGPPGAGRAGRSAGAAGRAGPAPNRHAEAASGRAQAEQRPEGCGCFCGGGPRARSRSSAARSGRSLTLLNAQGSVRATGVSARGKGGSGHSPHKRAVPADAWVSVQSVYAHSRLPGRVFSPVLTGTARFPAEPDSATRCPAEPQPSPPASGRRRSIGAQKKARGGSVRGAGAPGCRHGGQLPSFGTGTETGGRPPGGLAAGCPRSSLCFPQPGTPQTGSANLQLRPSPRRPRPPPGASTSPCLCPRPLSCGAVPRPGRVGSVALAERPRPGRSHRRRRTTVADPARAPPLGRMDVNELLSVVTNNNNNKFLDCCSVMQTNVS
ncbi:collagen alpha-1(I) chain-like [Corvus moneduloides]|uniref:collagen alpha-1(I) chain-like n=1 Tax=Corvus moneduloides TaxID=1196302 RepID=UPI00136349D4|nr:collagen alpha-1(I) chain-like [Corvus moneduloides]